MPENILYLSYDGSTDPLCQSQILPYIEGLSKHGYNFTIISFEKPHKFKEGRHRIEKRYDASNIDWQPLGYTKNPQVLSTLYDIDNLQKHAEKLHQKKKFALVHCRSYITSPVTLKLKSNYKLSFIFDMRGYCTYGSVYGKIWHLNNPVYKTITAI